MILRTDTIGHFENPTELNIQSAISYIGENASKCDIVKLMVDDANFICIWIGDKKTGHTLELKFNSIKKTCKEKFDSENAIKIMIKYLHGDLSWINDYSWEKSISQKFLENITLLARQMNKPEPST